MKIKWKVGEAPTGPYRSFFNRPWPSAEINGQAAAMMHCETSYSASVVKSGKHEPIKVYIAVWHENGASFDWRSMKKRFATIDEAKAAVAKYFESKA